MSSNDSSDVRLLRRVAARDTAALAELYDRYSPLLFGLILRILRNRTDAEEVLQEVFVRIWTRPEMYDVRKGGPLPWLVRLARNRAIDLLRSRRVRATVDLGATEASATQRGSVADVQTPEVRVLDGERHDTVTEALSGLPEEQRKLIEAAFFEGYTHSELAQRFGLPLGTVKSRIRTGMMAMRQRLEHVL